MSGPRQFFQVNAIGLHLWTFSREVYDHTMRFIVTENAVEWNSGSLRRRGLTVWNREPTHSRLGLCWLQIG